MTVSILISLLQRVSRSFLFFFLDRHALSDKFVNNVQNSNPRYGLILKQRLNTTVSSVNWLQTFMSETGPNRTLLWIHPLIRVPSWYRGNVYSRHKDWFAFPLGDGRAWKNCPISTNLKPASEHSLDNFWSSDNFSNRCSYSCSKSPCRSSVAQE